MAKVVLYTPGRQTLSGKYQVSVNSSKNLNRTYGKVKEFKKVARAKAYARRLARKNKITILDSGRGFKKMSLKKRARKPRRRTSYGFNPFF